MGLDRQDLKSSGEKLCMTLIWDQWHLAIADARADAQESINDALGRVDQLVADLSTYQTGINTQIQTIESAYESLNTIVQSNVSRIGATEAAIIQEATTRADGFVATAARIDGMVSRIDAVDASIIQEATLYRDWETDRKSVV